jgi:hypothetical protein
LTIPTEDVFYKTADSSGPIIMKLTLPSIDVKDAVARFPHEWSRTVDGFAAAAPAPAESLPAAVGGSGGNNRLINGIGVKEVIRPAPKHKGSAAAA